MENRIKSRFNQTILDRVLQTYDLADQQVHLLDGFESFIYEFERDEGQYILRIGHSSRRPENLIRGEVDWINYLHHGGAGVSCAVHAENGDLVVAVEDGSGEHFLATAFEKASGRPPTGEDLDGTFYEQYGRLLGRMHSLTRRYQPGDPAWKRPDWDDPLMLDLLDWLPQSEPLVIERYLDLKSYLDRLPKLPDAYGLIHFDAHLGNLFVDHQGKITLFDFDDCNYSWLVNDIAIVLFYIALEAENQAAFVEEFLSRFLRGYYAENQLDQRWLSEIPAFLKLREIDLYAIIHRSFDVNNIDHPWVARFMEGRRARIENLVPVIDYDFERVEFK